MPRPFTLSENHLQTFAQQQRQRFEDEMVMYLQKEYPTDCAKMGEAWIRELIGEGIKTAEGYNIVLERDVARYIEVMLGVAPDFDESDKTPWAGEVLREPRLTGRQKLDRIYEHLMFEPPLGESGGHGEPPLRKSPGA